MSVNKLLLGKLADEYREENRMKIIFLTDRDKLKNVLEYYNNDFPISLDITHLPKNDRTKLLKYCEERKGLTVISSNDIQDPILLSRFIVEKKSNIKVEDNDEMDLVEFSQMVEELKEDANYDIKKEILNNCPQYKCLERADKKVLKILFGGM